MIEATGLPLKAALFFCFAWLALIALFFFNGLDKSSVYVVSVVFAASILFSLRHTKPRELLHRSEALTHKLRLPLASVLPVAIDLFILVCFILSRTDAAIVTPWDAVHPFIIPLFVLSTLSLVLLDRQIDRSLSIAAWMLHLFTAWGASLMIFKIGFGFDPFIHQAAERYVVMHGFLLPKTILYSGQYALISSLSLLTGLSADFWDKILVPLASAALLPLVYAKLRRPDGTKVDPSSLVVFLLFPLADLTFTIPFNLALLLALLSLPLFGSQDAKNKILLSLLALLALLTHPLIGIPLCLMTLWHLLIPKKINPYISWSLILLLPVMLVAAFLIYGHRYDAAAPDLSIDFRSTLTILFDIPFKDNTDPFWLFLVHAIWRYSFLLLGALGLFSLALSKKTRLLPDRHLLAFPSLGVFLSALLVAQSIRLPDIISAEQFEFAFRLIRFAALITLPGLILWLDGFLASESIKRRIALAICLIPLVGFSWYMTYPQNDAIAHSTMPSVSADEMDTVKHIESRSAGSTYLVLAPQMFSAAALKTFGFENGIQTQDGNIYPYSIPTGGRLYAEYLLLYRVADPLPILKDIFAYTPADEIYVIIPHTWDDQGSTAIKLSGFGTSWKETGTDILVIKRQTVYPEENLVK